MQRTTLCPNPGIATLTHRRSSVVFVHMGCPWSGARSTPRGSGMVRCGRAARMTGQPCRGGSVLRRVLRRPVPPQPEPQPEPSRAGPSRAADQHRKRPPSGPRRPPRPCGALPSPVCAAPVLVPVGKGSLWNRAQWARGRYVLMCGVLLGVGGRDGWTMRGEWLAIPPCLHPVPVIRARSPDHAQVMAADE